MVLTFPAVAKRLPAAVLPLVLVAACSGGGTTVTSHGSGSSDPVHTESSGLTIPFPGAGNGGQSQLLSAGFTPNACGVAGATANFDGGSMSVAGPDNITCYYSSVAPSTPMAFLEQIVETAEDANLVHVRLTMNPEFVDNTYGDNAIGWGGSDASAPAPAGMTGPGAPATGPMAGPGGTAMAGGPMAMMGGPPGPGGRIRPVDPVLPRSPRGWQSSERGSSSDAFRQSSRIAKRRGPAAFASMP
ncbi:MAG TPA: hypothetical protein VHV30_15430, partial [Polyangiaceae bacterium]|nr:hypothetical protein [Polyangiaceae bacterium]